LTLVGDEPERSQSPEQARELEIANKILFAGWKAQTELRDLERDLLTVQFCRRNPGCFHEAIALGLPCVVSRFIDIPELIRDGVNGLLVTPADIEELAAAICQMMDKQEIRGQMALSTRERVVDKYNLHKSMAHLAEVFSQLKSRSPATTMRPRHPKAN
jgi:glycosyltransferase involved in cell wall biosynthesis